MAKTILCVDDSVTMQKVAEITFDASDFTYRGARNADDGLAAAKSDVPALILADAVMPGKTGYDLCQAIKNDPALAGVPVLIMCGNSQAYDAARGADVGADGHVVKPWDTQVMLAKIAEVLESGGQAQPAAPKPVAAAASRPMTPAPRPGTAPPRAATPPPLPKPMMPQIKQPEPPRSATIMGMPSIKLPGQPGADFGAATPVAPVAKKPDLAPTLKPSPPPIAPPMPRPISAPAPIKMPEPFGAKPLAPPPLAAVPTPAPAPLPSMSAPHADPMAGATIPEMPRPPMISGTPRRRPHSIAALDRSAAMPVESPVPAEVPHTPTPISAPTPISPIAPAIEARTAAAAADVAREAGLDPSGPEMAALTKLSREVVERVVWEVVPDLADAIIREHIAKNGLPR